MLEAFDELARNAPYTILWVVKARKFRCSEMYFCFVVRRWNTCNLWTGWVL